VFSQKRAKITKDTVYVQRWSGLSPRRSERVEVNALHPGLSAEDLAEADTGLKEAGYI